MRYLLLLFTLLFLTLTLSSCKTETYTAINDVDKEQVVEEFNNQSDSTDKELFKDVLDLNLDNFSVITDEIPAVYLITNIAENLYHSFSNVISIYNNNVNEYQDNESIDNITEGNIKGNVSIDNSEGGNDDSYLESDSTNEDIREKDSEPITDSKNTNAQYVEDTTILLEDGSIVDLWSLPGSIEDKISILREIYPSGSYWNHVGYEGHPTNFNVMITQKPCNHPKDNYEYCNGYRSKFTDYFPFGKYNTQCLAFANMFSDILYGKDADILIHSNAEEIKVGDVIRLVDISHSVAVIGVDDTTITVAEVNRDYVTCKIGWDRVIDKRSLGEFIVFTREVKQEP